MRNLISQVAATGLALIIIVVPVFAGVSPMPNSEPSPVIKSLIDAENSFAKLSKTNGMREAFLTYLTDDSVVFRPQPEKGQKAFSDASTSPNVLNWWPNFTEACPAGQLGYSTGPWEWRTDGQGEPVLYGNFVSIWQKQADNSWRVVVDMGTGNPEPAYLNHEVKFPEHTGFTANKTSENNHSANAASLVNVDLAFLKVSRENGYKAAFDKFAAPDVRLYREGQQPHLGLEAASNELKNDPGFLTWMPLATKVSAAGGLGYSYGLADLWKNVPGNTPLKSYSYLRIWRQLSDDKWALVLDITNNIPQEVKTQP